MNVQQALERLKSAAAYLWICKGIDRPWPPYLPERKRVEWREKDRTYKEAVDTVEKELNAYGGLSRKLQETQQLLEGHRRRGQVSGQIRTQRNKKWEGSYTKRVVDALGKAQGSMSRFDADFHKVQEAIELLTDYHNTMHLAYEQRDEARALAAQRLKANMELACKVVQLKTEINRLSANTVSFSSVSASSYAELQRELAVVRAANAQFAKDYRTLQESLLQQRAKIARLESEIKREPVGESMLSQSYVALQGTLLQAKAANAKLLAEYQQAVGDAARLAARRDDLAKENLTLKAAMCDARRILNRVGVTTGVGA